MTTVPRRIIAAASRPFRAMAKCSLRRKIVVGMVALVAIIVAANAVSGSRAAPSYSTAKVERHTITELVSQTGTITTDGKTDIVSPATGIVEELYVSNGAYVNEGTELFKIKSTATEQEKAAALANYQAAQAQLNAANSNLLKLQATMFAKWDTFKELAESDDYETGDGVPKYEQRALPEFHIPEKEWLAAEKDYKQQQTVIAQAQSAANSAYLAYQATQNAVVKATADGTVSNLSVTRGSTVSPQSTRPLALLTQNIVTEAVVSLSETDIAKVREGQEVAIEVNAVKDKGYKGVVNRVDSIGTEVKNVIRYNVYIQILDGDTALRPGMNVDADITTNTVRNVLSLPNAAVKPYQGGRAVRVADAKGEINYKPVKIGVKGEERTEILEGLKEGDEVVVALSNEQLKRPGLFGQ
jgi:multidrug efflux pump subunit AcrA (membrane-fusion protein)